MAQDTTEKKIRIKIASDVDVTVSSYKSEAYIHLSTNKAKWKSVTLKANEWEKLYKKQPKIKKSLIKIRKHIKKGGDKKGSKKIKRKTASISSDDSCKEENENTSADMSESETD